MEVKKSLDILKQNLDERKKYNHVISLMHWDLETQTPKNAVKHVSEVIGFFSQKVYEITNSKDVEKALGILNTNINQLNEIDQRIVYLATKEKAKLSKIPKKDYVEYTQLVSEAQSVWGQARSENDFDRFAPYLEKIIAYKKKYIQLNGYDNHPYDVLLDDYEEGMTVEKLEPFFNRLKSKVVPLLERIKNTPQLDSSCLKQSFDISTQKKLSKYMAKYLGFNFESGLLKESVHPFTLNFNKYDVRMTTRYSEDLFSSALFGTIHETGHALYEQNISDDIYNTILDTGVTLGIHESQSRFYENLVGKNKSFWQKQYRILQQMFEKNLANVDLDEFYKAINEVKPDFIRVEADELTYPLHILIRYELEKEILEKDIDVRELPELWNSKYQQYLGITPSSYAQGVMQDVHWSAGLFGYFPTYAIGTVYASQIYNVMNKNIDINKCLKDGDTKPILEFLTENIHKYGSSKTADEIMKNMSGELLNADYYLSYLENKFSEVYNLE